jgi:hypothetical protein
MADPRHAHTVADGESGHARAEPGYPADDFVARNHGLFGMLELTVDQMKVRAAHTARVNINQDLPLSGHRIG